MSRRSQMGESARKDGRRELQSAEWCCPGQLHCDCSGVGPASVGAGVRRPLARGSVWPLLAGRCALNLAAVKQARQRGLV